MEKSTSNSKDGNVGTPKHGHENPDPKSESESQLAGESKTEEKDNVCNNAEENRAANSDSHMNHNQILEDVDRFFQSLNHSDVPGEAPNSVELLCKMTESMIDKYNEGQSSLIKFGKDPENDTSFSDALRRVSKLSNELGKYPVFNASVNRASSVLQRAMSFLEEEFRALLEDSKNDNKDSSSSSSDPKSQDKTSKQSSFNNNNNHEYSDRCVIGGDSDQQQQSGQASEEEFPGFSQETVSKLNTIANTMISAGYDTECCMAYSISRRSAFKAALEKLGYDSISIDDVQRMQWESLEGEIATWITIVRQCTAVLFPNEMKLSDSVFSDHPSISQSLFSNMARAFVIKLLDFAEAVVLTKRSAEKLFKFLDMYETLRDLIPVIGGESYPPEISKEMTTEATTAKSRLGEAAVSIFCDLENSIKSDNGRTPVPSGAVHPLTRYVMNYLKYACEYKDTLEQVFKQCHKVEDDNVDHPVEQSAHHWSQGDETGESQTTPFSKQLMSMMDLLDSNLEMKSKLYRDPSLSYVFLMNNGRYIVQKIKGSNEIHQLMGDTWCRKRSSDLRQYHKNYQRETWGKVLQCLAHEGLQVNGKVSKPVLKERFKSFNAMFDEIHKTQSTWVVSDDQLQSELRVSISAVMIPAYRAFLGRFKQYLDAGRQAEKYIKYQPEDIETFIDELFDGNATSMARRRT
ncbi:exocyst complex component EXO70C1 [Cannabis sativa]|uniref:exocyst complex component EXO70C1 n=1 Tax=Cannabis sativa TaxID=3483 RepID=UPI0029CA878B|nr:exocyst complex component EXO70C1 [Cannabis sativa]